MFVILQRYKYVKKAYDNLFSDYCSLRRNFDLLKSFEDSLISLNEDIINNNDNLVQLNKAILDKLDELVVREGSEYDLS